MNTSDRSWIPSSLVHQTGMSFNVSINFTHSDWQADPNQSHPFLQDIRTAVLKYRIQSPTHFSIPIEVAQVLSQNAERTTKPHNNFILCVGFYNFGKTPVFVKCRPKNRRQRNGFRIITDRIEVQTGESSKWVPLERVLRKEFPAFSNIPVGDQVMFQWWQANGKVFNWPGLPNELKERIAYFCMHPSALPPSSKRRTTGALEVTSQFGKWAALLGVSRQVRTLCLRMCFVGSKDLSYGRGLCVNVKGHCALKDCLRRLGRYYQMFEPECLPTLETWDLVMAYQWFPRIHPHLDRYATLAQGIRKMCLQFSWLESMHFFKVTTGSFDQYLKSWRLSYQVFERFPHLNELRIHLPDARGYLMDSVYQDGPRLFYGDPFNCPRILHRIIYERVAEVLAIHDNVEMYGFLDEKEKERFHRMRGDARKRLKFTIQELNELYKEDEGGVELGKHVYIAGHDGSGGEVERDIIRDPFWPPKCRCEVRCRKVLYPNTT